jgi:hypothetical protein
MNKDKPLQLEMKFERSARSREELQGELLRYGGRLEELVVTRNRVSMVSARFDATGGVRVRIHEAFLSAPEAVITALGRYLVKRSRHEWLVVQAYVRGMGGGSQKSEIRSQNGEGETNDTLAPEGTGGAVLPIMVAKWKVYDLGAIFESVNQRFFNGKVKCGIGWGRRGTAKKGRARLRIMRFGSYSRLENVIRINPALDDESVALELVEYIVFHEMLHAALPSVEDGGRRAHHHRAYRMMERRFPGHTRLQKMAVELVGKRG